MVMKPMNGNTKWLITLVVTVFLAGGGFTAVKLKADHNEKQIEKVEELHREDMGELKEDIGVIQTDVKAILQKL